MKKLSLGSLVIILLSLLLASCGKKEEESQGYDAAFSDVRDRRIQEYNLDVQKDQASQRSANDTLALKEHILHNYPAGSYLVYFDRSNTFSVPRPAVIYYKADQAYVFAIVAKSKPGERLIETKNITGYESSFINLDSTKLGTAFFFLTLFSYDEGGFQQVWEKEIPMHGGFNRMILKTWGPQRILYVEVNFEDGIIVGHRNYNIFMNNGIRQMPHLLETYEGISRKRTIADVNKDNYPDYYEYTFYSLSNRIYPVDSVAFYWDKKRDLYVNSRNPRQTRPY
ncbi:MAG: hypothetical protein ACM3UR_07170 [Bacteroidota bacterium]|jgi:hypothetical protein|nr:hypothetical protein [Ignavibacteria bacterium]MCU7498694.1 hypothetical protein [Ignavibacteria bacterium]MCU7513905.1 hypothetical protein [Ignavibacteria bacterium]MCU7519244.1 hypothetical protein [Ignavibacteria bacterium]MCU7525537.1 hypothetical protein [Ignavibacteria bacterium]